MKTFTSFDAIPNSAIYLGSEQGDGSQTEQLADAIADAIEPVCFRDEEGAHHYFDLTI
jgi:hypothetical protein